MEMGEKVKDRDSGKGFFGISIPSSGHDKATGIPIGKNPIFIWLMGQFLYKVQHFSLSQSHLEFCAANSSVQQYRKSWNCTGSKQAAFKEL